MIPPIYLGEVDFEGQTFTRVQPLAVARGGAWRTGHNWRNLLPNEGKAFAPRQPPFHKGEVFAFDTEPNSRNEGDRDLYLVASSLAVEEVLDFRNGDPELARRTLVEVGLESMVPGTKQVIAALPDGKCVVVQMEPNPDGQGFLARLDGLEVLPVYALRDSLFLGDEINGRLLSVPGMTVGRRVGTTNWSRDADFLETVLKRLRRIEAAGPPPLPRAQIGPLVSYLTRAGLTPALGTDLEPLRTRLSAVAATLGENVAEVDQLVDLVSSIRPVNARVQAELAGIRTAIEAQLRAELDAELRPEIEKQHAELDRRRARLEFELADLEAQIRTARDESAEATTALNELRGALRDELIALESAVEELPQDAAASAAELTGRIAAQLRSRSIDIELAPDESPPWTRTRLRPKAEPSPWASAVGALNAAAKRFGYASEELHLADVAARSGALVVLPQAEADQFVRCYASVMACGEVVRHVLDPSVLSIDDLWRQPVRGKPAAFATAWATARLEPRRFRVVLMDGLQRTPMDLWLPSFADVIAGSARPRNLLIFASVSADAVDRTRTWRELTSQVIALRPHRRTGLSAEMLAAAVGTPIPVSCFDAEASGGPSRAELLDFADTYSGDASPQVLARVTGVLRAAWPLAPAVDPQLLALAFGMPGENDEGYQATLAAGADWLGSITGSWE